MKKLTLCMLFSAVGMLLSFRQPNYDSSNNLQYMNIEPIMWSYNDSIMCSRLYCNIERSNQQTFITWRWYVADSNGNIHGQGTFDMIDEDSSHTYFSNYRDSLFNQNATYNFYFISQKIGNISIINN